ncbi:MAG: hypothetical protein ACFE9S_19610 [Candidatus Hermodarchaeota archaeon]
MPESDNSTKDKFRIVIYHGHIHLLSTYDELEDNDNIDEIQNLDF